ncbi:glutathione S-transferase C-terminal domain-containing protein [Falsihalocynthiibacter arcticus]|uniref:Glutathione S-transferase n=1 Tax=Falsihalocynthiibacter arcticus TaxID=1579316 RepID=A0A126UZQ6_9RHOB|nr:glutathione S-transferase C-terminal domain-containing protein [Falsihalocynthiibacter arcticus]AML51116.1 glutathione S-transferase [Falsihalocynthiibacter arcticus]
MALPKTPSNDTPLNTSVEESQSDAVARRLKGEFVRGVSGFRSVLEEDSDFPAEPNRYHLFVALNCPWCHRVTLARNVLGLQNSITMDVAFPNRTLEDDPVAASLWEFNPQRVATLTGAPLPECTSETATGQQFRLVKQIYEAEGALETSVPILYDKKTKRIVANESAEIIRMLNRYAGKLGSTLSDADRPDLYPTDNAPLCDEIDRLNHQIYVNINNGAYKAGFSSSQDVYATAFENYFEALGVLEQHLAADNRPYLTGETFTEADLRLFPTLFRHDPVYYLRMKLNGAMILDYPHLWRWICRVYALQGVADSSALVHCRQGYFGRSWNNVVPLGPFRPMTYPEAFAHPELAR